MIGGQTVTCKYGLGLFMEDQYISFAKGGRSPSTQRARTVLHHDGPSHLGFRSLCFLRSCITKWPYTPRTVVHPSPFSLTISDCGVSICFAKSPGVSTGVHLAAGETFILLHPPLTLLGVSTWTQRGCHFIRRFNMKSGRGGVSRVTFILLHPTLTSSGV